MSILADQHPRQRFAFPARVMAVAVRWGKRGSRVNTISPAIDRLPL
jgi:hypothetical protein